ncbi:class I SAM-dependent methyltransferase [Streptomyces sp. FZ201]|uniref:class I SAM-dependent methyltransferase n=1 Tax=Streptomyces sp. FZ201 TaxID=3057122 RepID=UPI0021C0E064|nr:class I SAM-dependent methyltransferase [Streptomyces sp. FZ201]
MSGSVTSPGVEGAMGRGYARHSRVQHRADDYGMPLLHRALDAVVLPHNGAPFRVADLGAAAGTNSLDPMRAVVEGVRRRTGEDTPVTVVHTDILANDFNILFATVMDSPGTYAREPRVFVQAEARSFYEPLFPPGELHLAWSAIAVHWLSRVPAPIPGHIFSTRATGDIREAFKERSRSDWEAFLTHRARELRPGGQLVVLGGSCAEDGSSGAECLMDTADAVLADLVRQGLLTRAEHARMTVPTWNRTVDEFLAPLRAGPLTDVLRVEEYDLVRLPDIHLDHFRATGDARGFAEQVTAFFRAAFQPSLFSALDAERDAGDVERVAKALAAGLRARVAADPEAVETHWHVVPLRIARL